MAQKTSSLFTCIETLQGDTPWGTFLDAGTGVHSIGWVAQLPTERWTAVTGAPGDVDPVRNATESSRRPDDRIVLGNWASADLLKGEQYDTVLADYLLGAVEGFAPYFQDYLFARLRPLTRGVLYVTGVEPYVPAYKPSTEAGALVWEIGRLRDACLLLSGELPYREYPSAWVVDQLKRSRFAPRGVERFEVKYGKRFIQTQLDLCKSRCGAIADRELAEALILRSEALRAQALQLVETAGALNHGFNYVIAADPV